MKNESLNEFEKIRFWNMKCVKILDKIENYKTCGEIYDFQNYLKNKTKRIRVKKENEI